MVGASPKELKSWLWDFDARPVTSEEQLRPGEAAAGKTGFKGMLHKTGAFIEAHPFGTVPAAFSPDCKIGIFESNSIMRAVARLGEGRFPLYGHGPYEASRIDSFLDVSLVFARGTLTAEIHARMSDGFAVFAGGINQALSPDNEFLVDSKITLADICFVAELSLFFNEKTRVSELESKGLKPILHKQVEAEFPLAFAHFARLRKHPAFAPDVEPYLTKIENKANHVDHSAGR